MQVEPNGIVADVVHIEAHPTLIVHVGATVDLPKASDAGLDSGQIQAPFAVLGGFFGVGGGFIAGPFMFWAGVPMNFVVGTDLAHMTGKSIVASKRHRTLGHVDVKLGVLMVLGTIVGVEIGAQVIEGL